MVALRACPTLWESFSRQAATRPCQTLGQRFIDEQIRYVESPFLQHIFVDSMDPDMAFTVCSDLNTTTKSLDKLYKNWEDHVLFFNWPTVELD